MIVNTLEIITERLLIHFITRPSEVAQFAGQFSSDSPAITIFSLPLSFPLFLFPSLSLSKTTHILLYSLAYIIVQFFMKYTNMQQVLKKGIFSLYISPKHTIQNVLWCHKVRADWSFAWINQCQRDFEENRSNEIENKFLQQWDCMICILNNNSNKVNNGICIDCSK